MGNGVGDGSASRRWQGIRDQWDWRWFDVKEMARKHWIAVILMNAHIVLTTILHRLARRVYELQSLPYGLPEMASVIRVVETYRSSIDAIQSCKVPSTSEQNDAFCDLLAE